MNLLTKVIWEGKSRWQILVAGAGYCVGLFLVLFSLQLYLDIETLLYPDGNESDFYEYLIISKKISSLNTVESYLLGRGNSVLFSKEEIEDLEKQNFLKHNLIYFLYSICLNQVSQIGNLIKFTEI